MGGLLLFDITNRRSFQNVHEWLEEGRSHVQPHSIVFLLVGHKCDLEPQRQVSRQEAEKLAAAYGMRYVETSARDAINVERAFTELTQDIFELVKSGEITIQEGWEGVKSGFVPNIVHSSEEVTKGDRRCFCWVSNHHPGTYQTFGPWWTKKTTPIFLQSQGQSSAPRLWHHHPFPACWMPKWVPPCHIASLFYTTWLISLITQSCKWPNWTAKNERLLQNSCRKAGQNCICTLTSLIYSVEPRKVDFPNEDSLALDISHIENKLVPRIFYCLCHGADYWLKQVLLADFNDECWDMRFCWLLTYFRL